VNAEPQVTPFDVCGPLPSGVTVLEASAGTGKTYTIAALAARYVAEGIPLDQLLLVTFTRNATGELRGRVRERFVTAVEGLAAAISGVKPPPEDEVLGLLAEGQVEQLITRHRRLAAALTDFDAATIATTHGFCEHVLRGLGVAGDVEGDVTFVEDVSQLVEEVVDDFYVRKFHRGDSPPLTRADALRIAKTAVANAVSPLEPTRAPEQSVPAMRRRLGQAVREEVELRKRRGGLLTYDDILIRLRDTLADPARGPAACRRLRSRYRVALVDEFQDTDPVQWEIMRRAFGEVGGTLVLIGDPKQAIYAFRGADVYAYLDAARLAVTKATLATNWRSDKDLIDAYDTMFSGTRLGHEGIPYRTVEATAAHHRPRLVEAPVSAALRLRVVRRDRNLVALTPQGFAQVEAVRNHVAADLSADLGRLLSSPARILTRRSDGSVVESRSVTPGHVAVLVQRNKHAALIRDALGAAGIPAVINGAGSVFATPTAREWLRLLEALERPTSPTRAASAALTAFLGWSAEELASADDTAMEKVHSRLHQWAGLLRRRGVASLLEAATRAEGLPGRVLGRADGERQLTDLRHTGQLLYAASTSSALGVTAITAWLRQRIAEAGSDTGNEERSRRLESDAEAVQVLTIHRSKGLEFPVVYYPFLWEPAWIDSKDDPVFHDPDAGDRRTIDIGGSGGPDYQRHRDQFEREQRGEELRLAYVALTRAQHQAVVWWAGSFASRDAALTRLLWSRDSDGNVAAHGSRTPDDDEMVNRFGEMASAVPGCISVEQSEGRTGARWMPASRPSADLAVGLFDRTLDARWRRTSYSAITSGVHEARVGSESEQPVVSDEEPADPSRAADVTESDDDSDEAGLRSVPLLLGAMPGGREVGTFVHSVLENTDFAADDLDARLADAVATQQERTRLDVGDPAVVAAGLRAAIETPLGPVLGDHCLRHFGVSDRVNEMAFELPIAGGDSPAGELTMAAVAALLRRHLPPGDPLGSYADTLADPALQSDLRGFLSGSLDLVLRVTDGDGTPRFAVIDHKTNWLGPPGEELTAWHYRPAALAEEMVGGHYPLQALLYTVALHRYLRWRLPGYEAGRHLVGVVYLFIRGMAGAETPRVAGQPCGVFSWQPPGPLVEALSDLLDTGAAVAP